ncbi:MAG: TniB family NTP-binding protein [Chloroflexi bacterium]|nr:TniB family NTP-binding protein [Chloroflexota bacterium]
MKAVVPAKASMNNMLTSLLASLGDPLAGRGSMGVKIHRLQRFIGDCGVRMIILDEANHFVDRDSERVLHDVSNTMKNLAKTQMLPVCWLDCLTPKKSSKLTNSLAAFLEILKPWSLFRWNEEDPKTITEFRMFLHQVEQQLPLESRSFWRPKK